MLYHLLYPLAAHHSLFNLIRYETVRSVWAALTAFLLSLAMGPGLIAFLTHLKVGQTIRGDGPETHLKKAGTPTMGGLLIAAVFLISSLLWARLDNRFVWLALAAFSWFAAIGFWDDYTKLVLKNSKGISARAKMSFQVLGSVGFMLTYYHLQPAGALTSVLNLPFVKTPIGVPDFLYGCFGALVLVGASNGVNLTDGLDGLAIGTSAFVALAFILITYLVGHARLSAYLLIPHVPDLGEVAVLCSAMLGACLGFLWFNAHPAQVFMGDTGSLALGGFFGAVAILAKQEILLALVGMVFVLEALSVIVQVASFKMRGKRVFAMAPLHHHFELKGIPESKVIVRFWIVAALFMLAAVSTFKLR
ncbi:MAG TPA: phospho-N-acetylmuramoyl-pentapeptide-transferase [bacterium]|nr:phospho-N-acetylmuramoyl-pentapeptide-transferase [bacterium]